MSFKGLSLLYSSKTNFINPSFDLIYTATSITLSVPVDSFVLSSRLHDQSQQWHNQLLITLFNEMTKGFHSKQNVLNRTGEKINKY